MMDVSISNNSDKPIYQQLFEQISALIIRGDLENNYGLPPIRTAAKELRVSIITVKKAWEELERKGFIYTITGKGCFVADLTTNDKIEMRNELINEKMSKDIEYYRSLGLSESEVIEFIKYLY